jgi:hypothetical protein
MPILHILCYNGRLVTRTAVSLATAKFKPLLFSLTGNGSWPSLYNLGTDLRGNTFSIIAYVSVAGFIWRLVSHCVTKRVFAAPLPSNGCLCWLKVNTKLNENYCHSDMISPLRGQFYVFVFNESGNNLIQDISVFWKYAALWQTVVS